jgi:hypothetical protein
MSFEVYLQCFGETERLGLSSDAIRLLFPVSNPATDGTYWPVSYDSLNSCDIDVGLLPNGSDRLTSLCVHRPCGDMRLWKSLYAILNMGSVVLFFPGGPPILAEGISPEGLPREMVDSIGEPVFVDSAEAILRILREC